MSLSDLIPDRLERTAAETTFDRNVVVIAGAGTGKTTLLVNRVIHLLVKEPHPVPVTQIVALTFTNKAATEMKVRLRERLHGLVRSGDLSGRAADGGSVTLDDLTGRYALGRAAIVERATAALADLDKAQIGTLHSFAAHLLRLHPIECGVDPAFQEDDGSRFDSVFTQAWDLWLDQELGRSGTRHELWRSILGTTTLDALAGFARSLCSELVELEALQAQVGASEIEPRLAERLRETARRGETLLAAHARPRPRRVETMLEAAISVLGAVGSDWSAVTGAGLVAERAVLGQGGPSQVLGWEEAEFDEAKRIIKLAQDCLEVDHQFFNQVLRLLLPLVRTVRASLAGEGWISFDGLLARARALLRDHPHVRERLKRDYRAVLVDEFQDTDPLQYEVILAVSEAPGHCAASWQDMELEPGKLCIVGDPKQSIYAFRRADIEAFDRVVEQVVASGGLTCTLTTNFRSDPAVLAPINALFDRVFERRTHVQPGNVRLDGAPQRRSGQIPPGVRVRLVRADDEEDAFAAGDAARAEAETLARWLAEDLLRRPNVTLGHVALLFRKLTQADVYLDALRRHGLSYVIDGEKHFYRRQEVVDFVNLLRVLANPHDQIAMVGVLRSPLGALTDREVYEVCEAGHLDYRRSERLGSWSHPRADAIGRLYRRLAGLQGEVAIRPLSDALQTLFDRVPLLELAAASLHGEQAVANLLKVKRIAAAMADHPSLTLSGFVELLTARVEEPPDEAESPLAEETADAVQVLTIHKAKGLEFPIVVLPGLHQGVGRTRTPPAVVYDWSSGLYGLCLGERKTLGGLLLHDTLAIREIAEHRRVLYVGMTRARDLLVLSGGVTARVAGDSVLRLLDDVTGGQLREARTTTLSIGEGRMPQEVLPAPPRRRAQRPLPVQAEAACLDPADAVTLWTSRNVVWGRARATPWHLTPTRSEGVEDRRVARSDARGSSDASSEVPRLAGMCAHWILQRWDFSADPRRLLEDIDSALAALPDEERGAEAEVAESLREALTVFAGSESYDRLRQSVILGRELPFIMPWGDGQVMEGTIDVIYRLDDRLWVADYKTEAVRPGGLTEQAERYRRQVEIYRVAVEQALGLSSVGMELMFLRAGRSVRF